MRIFGLFLASFFLFPLTAGAQTTKPAKAASSSPQEIEEEIHEVETNLLPAVTLVGDAHPQRSLVKEMERLHVPAVSIAVIHNGTIRWAHAWGSLNAEGGPAATPDTLFQAASISKSLAAMAALHLVQQGKLSLDAPVQTELKSWKLPQNGFTAQQP